MAGSVNGQRTVGSGQYTDQLFSADSSKLYAVSETGVTILDVASGATLASYSFGDTLSGADLSPDGTKLLVADRSPTNDYPRFFELDLTTGVVTKFSDSAHTLSNSTTSVNFNDVAFLSNTTALVTAGNGGSDIVSFRRYDLTTGTWTAVGDGRGGDLTPSDDHSHVVATYFGGGGAVFLPDGSVSASYPDTGANRYLLPEVAITSDGSVVALGGPDFPSGLAVGTNSFAFGTSPAASTPYLANPGSLALGPDGHSLFEGTILVDLTTNQAVGAYGLHGTDRQHRLSQLFQPREGEPRRSLFVGHGE